MPNSKPSLEDVSEAFDAYDQQKITFRELLLIEQEFYQTAKAADLAMYAQKIGRGRYFGLHPIYVCGRPDFKQLSATTASFGGGQWEIKPLPDARDISKDLEYILIENTTS